MKGWTDGETGDGPKVGKGFLEKIGKWFLNRVAPIIECTFMGLMGFLIFAVVSLLVSLLAGIIFLIVVLVFAALIVYLVIALIVGLLNNKSYKEMAFWRDD